MLLLFIIIYAVSLLYLAVTERFRHYAWLVGLQGWLLMGIAVCYGLTFWALYRWLQRKM